MNFSSQHFFKN